MADYLTTKQLSSYLNINEKKIYLMIAEGQIPATRVSGKWLFERELIDQWMREKTIYPATSMIGRMLDRLVVIQGSDDWLMDRMIDDLRSQTELALVTSHVGSLKGLSFILAGAAHLAGFHLAESDLKKNFNQKSSCYFIDLYRREQGLVVSDHCRELRTLGEVVERKLRFAVRQESSGTYRLTQRLLQEAGADLRQIDLTGPFHTHLEVALAVRSGKADAGLCIRIAAELCGLSFVPLREEDFRLAIPAAFFGHPNLAWFMERMLEWFKTNSPKAPGYRFDTLGRLSSVGVVH